MKRPIKKQHELSEPGIYKHVFPFAKENRRNPTPAEKKLWEHLRNRQVDGFKFRRQHVIDRYIADFVCIDAFLIVEVDGGIHHEEENKKRDAVRTAHLEGLGFRVIRFTNEQVIGQRSLVVEEIRKALHSFSK